MEHTRKAIKNPTGVSHCCDGCARSHGVVLHTQGTLHCQQFLACLIPRPVCPAVGCGALSPGVPGEKGTGFCQLHLQRENQVGWVMRDWTVSSETPSVSSP